MSVKIDQFQSERLIKFNEAKKGSLPSCLSRQETELLSRMLHSLPDWRPDAEDILALAWMEDTASRRTERRQRRREDTITSLDIRDEEILDN